MMLKLVSGFELGGQASHLWGEGLERIEAGSRASVRFRFQTADLGSGSLVEAGINGLWISNICSASMQYQQLSQQDLYDGLMAMKMSIRVIVAAAQINIRLQQLTGGMPWFGRMP